MIAFKITGKPAAQGSKRHVGGGRLIEQSKKVAPWRKKIAAKAAKEIAQPITGAVCLIADFAMPRPKSMARRLFELMIVRPDLDKLLRALDDGLTKIAYTDDSQIVEIHARKRRADYGEETGAYVKLIELDGDYFAWDPAWSMS